MVWCSLLKPVPPNSAKQRIAYIDWLRGFACLLMFETHGYNAWLSPAAKHSALYQWSQLGGTLPAPLFLFLAGVSFALVVGRMTRNGFAPDPIAKRMFVRGAQILGFGFLFRLQEYLLGQPWAPWTDLLRVDILNVIGVSLMLLSAMWWIASLRVQSRWAQAGAARFGPDALPRARYAVAGMLGTAAVALVTPVLWTTHRLSWLPWYIETYINGVHTFNKPQAWLFPIFPWSAFAFAGLAVGFLLLSPWARKHEFAAVSFTATSGAFLFALGTWFDSRRTQLYAVYDFWHTSPNFFLMRLGIVMCFMLVAYAWCRWGAGQWSFHPAIQLGQTSLFVYWVHIEFVYGRFSILTKGGEGIWAATVGIIIISIAMTALAYARNRMKGHDLRMLVMRRKPMRVPV